MSKRERPVAMVTGASRGIGKAIALTLAASGYDVAVTGRTVHAGDPSALAPENGAALPGSLDETVALVEGAGGRAVAVPLDLLDGDAIAPAVDAVVAAFGRIDVLVNNAIYVGPGNTSRFLDNDPRIIADRLFGNLTAQLLLSHRAVGHMVAQGGGTVLNITSAAGYAPVTRRPGDGGWSLAYGVSKAGFTRVAQQLAVEYGDEGIRAYNLNPGFVATERVLAAGASLAWVAAAGIDPAVIGMVVAWVLGEGSAGLANGALIEAVDVAARLGFGLTRSTAAP